MNRAREPLLSDAWLVATAPSRTFEALVAADAGGSWPRALAPIAFGLAVLATAATVLATRVVALPTLLSVAASWVVVPLIQLGTAAWLCRGVRKPRVALPRELELLFIAHLPWTLWLIVLAAAALWLDPGPAYDRLLLGVLVPAIWTPLLLAAFCRRVLGLSPSDARRRTAVHQAMTWGAIVIFAIATIQPWARYGPYQ